jgi:beta-lactamase class A
MNRQETQKKAQWLWILLGALGVVFVLASALITAVEYQRYRSGTGLYPPGSRIAGVPVGGLDAGEAASRLQAVYGTPLILTYQGAMIHAAPQDLGFSMDIEGMLTQASPADPSLSGFWGYLWGREALSAVDVPLMAGVDETLVEGYLQEEIAPRYDNPGESLRPLPGTTNLQLGQAGHYYEPQQSITAIKAALLSPTNREAELVVLEGPPKNLPSATMFPAFLKHQINWTGFDGLVEIYMQALDSDWWIHFAVWDGEAVEPDVAFTAASTIKIPIMVSVLRRTPEPTPQGVITLMEQMIVLSENPPADALMETYLDAVRGPLLVSEDLTELGFENTFLAGYFHLGAPVLALYETPANTRTDVNLDPDVYNQTTPAEAGKLLEAIYHCAMAGEGLLVETFPGEITQSECQLIVDILSDNQIGLLIEAGLPPSAVVAHKHGWVQELDGLLHSMSDVAIVSTEGGDYVLNIFIYDAERLDFEAGNRLIARLSQTVYNFFNLQDQAHWWFD